MKCALGGCGDNPSELAGSIDPREVVADGTNVYFTDVVSETVFKCPPGGCGNNPTPLADNQSSPWFVAVYGGVVYWTDNVAMTVRSCANGNVDHTGRDGLDSIAVDGTNVYWTEYLSGNVLRCAIGGCSKNPTAIASGRIRPCRIVLNDSSVFWTDFGNDDGTGGAVLILAK
ncbi:MAG TPA: hypothetical protein VK762_10615, partial [Polyangiaceae bacterium]|nr:hypothetical protein [Polyangiaceae bacterium]